MSEQAETPGTSIVKRPCSSCGLPMPAGYPLCSECGSFQNWRRFVSLSAPVLGLLVALVSVTGVMAPVIGQWFWPSRASLSVSAEYSSPGVATLSLINLGKTEGVVANELHCVNTATDNSLSFRSEGPALVKEGEQRSVSYEMNSTWTERYMQSARSGEFELRPDVLEQAEVEMGLRDPFTCSLSATDKFGPLSSIYLTTPILSLSLAYELPDIKSTLQFEGFFSEANVE